MGGFKSTQLEVGFPELVLDQAVLAVAMMSVVNVIIDQELFFVNELYE